LLRQFGVGNVDAVAGFEFLVEKTNNQRRVVHLEQADGRVGQHDILDVKMIHAEGGFPKSSEPGADHINPE
jgi:hypothetical protein